MKKFSMLLFFAVTMMALASCGGASKKSEAKTEEVKECCLPIGLQLYSVRDDMAKDFKGTLQKVKEMGYEGVEFAGLYSIFPSIRVLSNESVLHIRWPKYWSFSFSISPSSVYSGLISGQ